MFAEPRSANHIKRWMLDWSTFAAGGPRSVAVGLAGRIAPFLPVTPVGRSAQGCRFLDERKRLLSIDRRTIFMGNADVRLRAYIYIRMIGRDGLQRIGDIASLNGTFRSRRATHEFIVTLKAESRDLAVTAMDVAKRLLDFGHHALTTYFPLLVPECLLIEPTKTESRETVDGFAVTLHAILNEAREDVSRLKGAPYTLPVRRLDDVRAAKQLELVWRPDP